MDRTADIDDIVIIGTDSSANADLSYSATVPSLVSQPPKTLTV